MQSSFPFSPSTKGAKLSILSFFWGLLKVRDFAPLVLSGFCSLLPRDSPKVSDLAPLALLTTEIVLFKAPKVGLSLTRLKVNDFVFLALFTPENERQKAPRVR